MSMAFLRDDAEGEMPRRHYGLPPRDDPDYDRVAAQVEQQTLAPDAESPVCRDQGERRG